MNTELLLGAIGEIGDDKILDAETVKSARRGRVRRAAAAAAVIVLVVGGIFAARSARLAAKWDEPIRNFRPDDTETQLWSEEMTAADYFKNNRGTANGASSSSAASLAYPPYAASISFDGERTELEAAEVIPELPDHPEQSFGAYFNGDGSLYKVRLLWMRRGDGLEEYSDLAFTAAPKEIRELSDVVIVPVDAEGNTVAPEATVTMRDGVAIIAEGFERGEKTLTWSDSGVWYQIEGSWNDSCEDMVSLLDWFWAHPFVLEPFAARSGDLFTISTSAEHPEAFAAAIPDFAALGYAAESDILYFAKGAPVEYEGVYVREDARVRWTVKTTMDGHDVGKTAGWLKDATEERLTAALGGGSVTFDHHSTDGRFCRVTVTLESGAAHNVSGLIKTLQ